MTPVSVTREQIKSVDEPKRRGRPPRVMAQPTDRLAVLTGRERALALKARLRHKYTFDLPLELYEELLDQAEGWSQPLPDVVRACIRKGLDHIKQFGTSDHNPYVYGRLNPPTQADIDPSGYAWPPTPAQQMPSMPNWELAPPLPIREDLPTRMQFIPSNIKPGMLPSGATVSLGHDKPSPSKTPFIPEDPRDEAG